ncbi:MULTISPECIES: hypothetical protein [Providencia]|uniref:Uncharacterized protein n=1 Tax=Providencia rettgeri TaxID=587 RepID=A0AAJ4NJJ7_PRORE|nr:MULTISPECIES: hypothetical protein [Providencia]MBQ0534822.1 hypothetical protein [Providencia huaxiensis]MBQ0587554.1 hypothetical protein [Providencia huaxiensis]PYZ58895.1 hypothetical protein DNK63_07115 [Providencia rettgeri]QWQ16873.1 hypothetical protein KOL65_19455 [Providencia rettgeri]QWQ19389.1 hypothetical protein KOF27_12155 [Providencia rettgeri]
MRTHFFPPYEPEFDDKMIGVVIGRIVMFKESYRGEGATEIYLDTGEKILTSLSVNEVNKIIVGY